MIYTVTLNPSIDLYVEVDKLNPGYNNNIKTERTLPGGKAINVSRILSQIRIPTTATGFTGGYQGLFIKDWLSKEKILADFVDIKENNRINIKIFEDLKETVINFQGPTISSEEVEELLYYLSRVREGDTIIFGGSVPPMENGEDSDIYDRMVEIAKANGAYFVADVPSQYLINMVKRGPLLVKPNGEDIEAIFNVKIEDKMDYIPYGKELIKMGAKYVIISYGSEGSMFFTNDGVYAAAPVEDDSEIINTVACRDAMIGGFIGTIVRDNDPIESYMVAVAAASATARVLDLPTRDQIVDILPLVDIEIIE
ncbi:1-phosphofructokinase family hexose kinase [uncultured Anaerococcus sp.]|uniref:1-phosphofructokinase family hexose kinase n=1 Tax=uncultured Anaerococcus sp. TaxID=293428 RepID=UPI0025FFB0F2|nr:1-phosphofructokinase family hexose kinase [uncultured Anaerococcus sp.]